MRDIFARSNFQFKEYFYNNIQRFWPCLKGSYMYIYVVYKGFDPASMKKSFFRERDVCIFIFLFSFDLSIFLTINFFWCTLSSTLGFSSIKSLFLCFPNFSKVLSVLNSWYSSDYSFLLAHIVLHVGFNHYTLSPLKPYFFILKVFQSFICFAFFIFP